MMEQHGATGSIPEQGPGEAASQSLDQRPHFQSLLPLLQSLINHSHLPQAWMRGSQIMMYAGEEEVY